MKRFQKMIKSMTAGALVVFLCVLAVMPAFSMGFHAIPGASASGAAPFGEQSVLQVESLKVCIDIPEVPEGLYENEQKIWESYVSFTSRYALYNPTDACVIETVAIPFGKLPDYTYDEDDTNPVLPYPGAYTLTFREQSLTPAVRHTLAYDAQRNDQFEELADSAWYKTKPISDTKMTDEILFPNQKVYVYTYRVSNPDAVQGSEFKLLSEPLDMLDPSVACVYLAPGSQSEGRLLGYADQDGETFEVYVIGKDTGELTWQAMTWGDEILIDSITVSLQGKSETTFGDLAMTYYTPDCGASEVDWYNAVYCYFAHNTTRNGIVDAFKPGTHDITDYLQGWLLYEITLEPYEHAELVTSTPAFPDIINIYEPYVYEYAYDLKGLSRFASVGTVELTVNTPCPTVEHSSYNGYQVPAGEYTLTLDRIEKETILFSICEKEQPANVVSAMVYGALGTILLIGLGLLVLIGILIAVAIMTVFVIIRVIKRKKAGKTADVGTEE